MVSELTYAGITPNASGDISQSQYTQLQDTLANEWDPTGYTDGWFGGVGVGCPEPGAPVALIGTQGIPASLASQGIKVVNPGNPQMTCVFPPVSAFGAGPPWFAMPTTVPSGYPLSLFGKPVTVAQAVANSQAAANAVTQGVLASEAAGTTPNMTQTGSTTVLGGMDLTTMLLIGGAVVIGLWMVMK